MPSAKVEEIRELIRQNKHLNIESNCLMRDLVDALIANQAELFQRLGDLSEKNDPEIKNTDKKKKGGLWKTN